MIAVRQYPTPAIRKAYDARSWIYSKLIAPREHSNHLLAIELANIQPGEKILEVAVGPGLTLVELARKAGRNSKVTGWIFPPACCSLQTEECIRQDLLI
jgi:ubiquinone/menaquinone biosynthesis C-methylase UbiE